MSKVESIINRIKDEFSSYLKQRVDGKIVVDPYSSDSPHPGQERTVTFRFVMSDSSASSFLFELEEIMPISKQNEDRNLRKWQMIVDVHYLGVGNIQGEEEHEPGPMAAFHAFVVMEVAAALRHGLESPVQYPWVYVAHYDAGSITNTPLGMIEVLGLLPEFVEAEHLPTKFVFVLEVI